MNKKEDVQKTQKSLKDLLDCVKRDGGLRIALALKDKPGTNRDAIYAMVQTGKKSGKHPVKVDRYIIPGYNEPNLLDKYDVLGTFDCYADSLGWANTDNVKEAPP